MNTGFTIGWVASKSGIRNVTDYNTSSETWSDTHFPNGDGSPYYSVAMDPNDDSIVFVGNQKFIVLFLLELLHLLVQMGGIEYLLLKILLLISILIHIVQALRFHQIIHPL